MKLNLLSSVEVNAPCLLASDLESIVRRLFIMDINTVDEQHEQISKENPYSKAAVIPSYYWLFIHSSQLNKISPFGAFIIPDYYPTGKEFCAPNEVGAMGNLRVITFEKALGPVNTFYIGILEDGSFELNESFKGISLTVNEKA